MTYPSICESFEGGTVGSAATPGNTDLYAISGTVVFAVGFAGNGVSSDDGTGSLTLYDYTAPDVSVAGVTRVEQLLKIASGGSAQSLILLQQIYTALASDLNNSGNFGPNLSLFTDGSLPSGHNIQVTWAGPTDPSPSQSDSFTVPYDTWLHVVTTYRDTGPTFDIEVKSADDSTTYYSRLAQATKNTHVFNNAILYFPWNGSHVVYDQIGANCPGFAPPPPPPPEGVYAFDLTEITSTLAPASGKVVESYQWTQVSPADPVLDLHPNGPVLRFVNPAVLDDTDFVVRLTITDNLGGTQHTDYTVHVKGHDYWALVDGDIQAIETVHQWKAKYTQTRSTRDAGDLLVPYETVEVFDQDGWLATFTTGSRSVLLRRTDDPPALAADPYGSVFAPTERMLLLPERFDGTVDEVLLDEMATGSVMDLYDIVYAMANNNITTVNGVQVYGPNDYDATADLNDFMGITLDGDAPDLAKTGTLSPAGFVRLVFGPVGLGMPLSEIPADMLGQATRGTAPGVSVIDTHDYMPSDHLIGFLQMGDVLGFTSPSDPTAHHVGIYLGLDDQGRRRFISMRQDKNGVSVQDGTLVFSTVSGYRLPYPARYTGWLRSAQRY